MTNSERRCTTARSIAQQRFAMSEFAGQAATSHPKTWSSPARSRPTRTHRARHRSQRPPPEARLRPPPPARRKRSSVGMAAGAFGHTHGFITAPSGPRRKTVVLHRLRRRRDQPEQSAIGCSGISQCRLHCETPRQRRSTYTRICGRYRSVGTDTEGQLVEHPDNTCNRQTSNRKGSPIFPFPPESAAQQP